MPYVSVLYDRVVTSVYMSDEENWSEAHRAQFPNAEFIFTEEQPAIGSVIDLETGEVTIPVTLVVEAVPEELPE